MGEGSDLLKYMTHRAATYLTTPPAPAERKANRLPWTTQWFGMVPMGMQLWWEDKRGKPARAEAEPTYENL
ncbi:YqzE family protein [Cohnella lubricantis]|uniref:YqzE family protein n=1 Tax=Cohnella lubricantis TaxID=2163172 RepID=A0A841T7K2_9BACL|nr:YqzE family protein [Cohnella lubricantis]MBB6676882.1 YqzE family protein [Cohnella lubricantis]MBP2118282.1 hypothetical protein [Cohnella lubricantis]